MKKISFILILVLLFVNLLGCKDGYVNKYSAKMLRTLCWDDEASIAFYDFKGTYHFKLKGKNNSDHTLEYEASLAEGEINVYIGTNEEKELLFTIKSGESHDRTISLDDKYDDVKTIYIFIESKYKSLNGDFEFEYN